MSLIISPDFVPLFTSTTDGTVPASGGGTTNFLRADGTWQPTTAGSYLSASTTSTQDGYFTGINLLESGTTPTFYTRLVSGTDLTASTTLTLAGLGTADRTLTFPGGNASVTLASISNISQNFAGITTFTNATVTVGTSTAAATYGLGTGATVAAATKDINIGTNGVATSITNINIGSQTSNTTSTIYGSIIHTYDEPQGASPYSSAVHYFEPQSSSTAFGIANSPFAAGATFLGAGTVPYLWLSSGGNASSFVTIATANNTNNFSFSNDGRLTLPKQLQFDAIADPTAPAASKAYLYAKDIAGRIMPKWIGPSGVDYPLQANIGFNNIRMWRGGATAVATTFASTIGTMPYTGASPTAPTIPALAATNLLTQTVRSTISTGATAGGLAYIRANQLSIWRGNANGFGGFMVVQRFALSGTLQTGLRVFAGIVDVAANPTNIDPLTTTTPGGIGIAANANTGNWSLVYNITGTARTSSNLGASFPIDNTSLMELVLWCPPNASSINYRVTNLSTAATTSGSISTNIPANTTFLAPSIWVTNNATAAAQTLDFISTYVETDY